MRNLAVDTLHARSLPWFEKFMAAGLDLQSLHDWNGQLILPLMADLSPERLSTWLEGKTFNITQQIINNTPTPEGRAGLQNLINQEKVDVKNLELAFPASRRAASADQPASVRVRSGICWLMVSFATVSQVLRRSDIT